MTRLQTSSGLAVDLAAPDLTRIDVEIDIAGPLSRLARFAGHRVEVAGEPLRPIYTVAQHCVVGADALLAESDDVGLAFAFLIHDAHEALIGDLTTPTVLALEAWVEEAMLIAGGREFAGAVREAIGCGPVRAGIDGMKNAIDAQIHRLAGLCHPLPGRITRAVKEMDLRMLDLERRLILGQRLRGVSARDLWGAVIDAPPVRLRGALVPWGQKRARQEWMHRWTQWRGDGLRIPTPPPVRSTHGAATVPTVAGERSCRVS